MKILFAFILLLPVLSYGQAVETVAIDSLVKRDGIYYKSDSGNPFTGVGMLYHNGQKLQEVNYKDGKAEGLWINWYENGQKQYEGNYKDGKEEGLWNIWNNNGQKSSEINFKDGEEVSRKEWDENGNEIKN